MTFWLNGAFHDDPAAIDIADRGFLLGDGLFETLLVTDGKPVFLAQHIRRMRDGMSVLAMTAQADEGAIAEIINTLAVKNDAGKGAASARITVTRGCSARGLAVPEDQQPTVLVTVNPYAPSEAAAPIELIISRCQRNENSISAKLKTLNYVDNIFALQDAQTQNADDAIMLNSQGRIACATAANVFVITRGEVRTPPISEGAMPGIVRARLLCAAKNGGPPIRIAPVDRQALQQSVLILTNSLTGLRPGVLRGGPSYDERSTRILRALQSCYADAVSQDLSRSGLQ